MSSIKAFESLSGILSGESSLSGKLTIPVNPAPYDGGYEVVPNAFNTQILNTANKLLQQDLEIKPIPYFETENIQNGVTIYIGGEL